MDLMIRSDKFFLAYTIFSAILGALLYGDDFCTYSLYGAICFLLFCICFDVYMVVCGIVKYVKEGGKDGNCYDDGCNHDARN